MDVKVLIQSIVGNFNQYQSILQKIAPFSNQPQAADTEIFAEINTIFLTLTEIQDEVIEFRLKKILSEQHPYLPVINPQKLNKNKSFSPAEIQSLFVKQRSALQQIVESLPRENWERKGLHENEGHITFRELVRRLIEKDQVFIERLLTLLKTLESRSSYGKIGAV